MPKRPPGGVSRRVFRISSLSASACRAPSLIWRHIERAPQGAKPQRRSAMDKLGKLDLVGIVSVGVVAAGLLAGWMATTAQINASHERKLSQQAVTLTPDGRMKVKVTAQAEAPAATRQVNTASSRTSSGPSISTLAPMLLRP
jgi:hypothetical protein